MQPEPSNGEENTPKYATIRTVTGKLVRIDAKTVSDAEAYLCLPESDALMKILLTIVGGPNAYFQDVFMDCDNDTIMNPIPAAFRDGARFVLNQIITIRNKPCQIQQTQQQHRQTLPQQ